MTRNPLAVSLALSVALLTACSPRPDGTSGASSRVDHQDLRAKLVGEWKGLQQNGSTAGMIFRQDSSVVMYEDDEGFDASDVDGKLVWRAYGDSEPLNLDIIAIAPGREPMTIKMIMRFLSDEQIEIRMNEMPGIRPAQFEDPAPEGQVVLTKQ